MSDLQVDERVDIGASWDMEVFEGGIPSKDDQEKAAKGLPELFSDSLAPHPKTIVATTAAEEASEVSAVSEQTHGWSSKDVLVDHSDEQPVQATSWWQSMVDGLRYWTGMSDVEEAPVSAQIDASAADTTSWVDYFDPRALANGACEMAVSLWNTITFAEQAFADPAVDAIEIPATNVDGTANPFGGRTINRDDYKELCRFRDDCQELLDRLNTIRSDGELEAYVVALTKALAADKEEEFDYQRTKLSRNYKDRELDVKLRDKASKELVESIQSNEWYNWFFETATRSSFALGGAALGAVTGGWGWAVPVIVLSGVGVLNSYMGHKLEKGVATVTATASTFALGGDYSKNHARHTDRLKTAHTIFMWGMSASVLAAQAAATGLKGVQEAAFKGLMSLSGISQNLGQIAKTYNYRKSQTVQANFEYLQDRLKEHEKTLSSGIKRFSKTSTDRSKMFKEGAQRSKQSHDAAQSIFRS